MTENVTNADPSMIDEFKKKARDFWNQWESLGNQEKFISKQAPEIQQEFKDLRNRGLSIRNSVETVTGLIDKATAAYRTATGWVSDIFGTSDNTMGFLPILIPAAVIVGSLAAMGKWLSDAYQFNRKMDEIAKLQAKGIDPVTASKIISRITPEGFSITTSLGIPLLLIGGFFVYNTFMKKGK